MKSYLGKLVMGIAFSSIMLCLGWGNADAAATQPKDNKGKPWRIAYYEAGDYPDYQKSLIATVEGLMNLGWIEKTPIPEQMGGQTKDLWAWLSDNLKSPYIAFPKDAHYTAGWKEDIRATMTADLLKRLNQTGDIDLVIAAGTKAGKDLACDKHRVPVLVISTSSPVEAGIIKSAEDSGLDHVHARVDPQRFERQIQIFHDVIKFKHLGVAHENTESGRTQGALQDIENMSKKLGFDIVPCFTVAGSDKAAAEASVQKCFKELADKKVEGIYVTTQVGVSSATVPTLAGIANEAKIPTFSQASSKEVKDGFLLSMSRVSFAPVGQFYADTIVGILNGAKPRAMPQKFEAPPRIAINLKTAEEIGVIDKLPMRLLRAADEIFQ